MVDGASKDTVDPSSLANDLQTFLACSAVSRPMLHRDGSAASNLVASGVTRKRFERLVAKALRDIPKRFRDEMSNVAVVVDDQPSPELLKEMEIVAPDTLYGLYQGTPLPDREWTHSNVLPDQITIYQGPIVEGSDDEDDIICAIGETVIHEFGHYFGLSEEEIEEIESRYWRGDTDVPVP